MPKPNTNPSAANSDSSSSTTEPLPALPPAPPLTPAGRKALRAQAHHLDPVVMIGDAGLTPQVMAEIEKALRAHQLIKIRVLGDDRDMRNRWLSQITQERGCMAVQHIGKLLVVWRPNPKKPQKSKIAPQKTVVKKSIRGATSPVRKKNAPSEPRELRDSWAGRPPRPSQRSEPAKGPAGLRPAAKPSSFRSPAGRFGDPETRTFTRRTRETDLDPDTRRPRESTAEPYNRRPRESTPESPPRRPRDPASSPRPVRPRAPREDREPLSESFAPARPYNNRTPATRTRVPGGSDQAKPAPAAPAPAPAARPPARRPAASRPSTAGISKLRKVTRNER